MPEVRDIIVHVTTSAGVELPEWGVHSFRRNHKTSAYIQSKTDMPFRVSITPKIPYIAADVASAHVYETRRRGSDRPGFFQMEDEWEDMDGGTHYRPGEDNHGRHNSKRGASRLHSRFSSEYGAADRRIKREPSDMGTSFSSPPPSRNFRRIPPPHFHFLASMYLDGRSKAERKLVVYLDPEDEDFNRPDGKVSFKTRWVEGKDGKLREHGWVFKDVGIETVFDKMLLSGDHQVSGKVHMRDEDSIIAAMNAADLGAEGDIEREERTKLGQIVVTIERIKLGQKWVDSRFRAKHKEGDVDDIQMDGANTDITHTAGFGQATALRSEAVRVVAYTPYLEGEGVYATFQFFYRSEEMLRKFNFPGFHQSQAIHRDRRYLNAKLATLTPLGISQPLRPKKVSSKENIIPFEEVIKKGTSPVKQPSDYQFGDEYRENDEKDEKDEEIKKEESVCGLDDADPLSSPPYSTPRSGSRSPPKFSSKGKEKENLKPENNYKLTDVGQHDPHRTPLGNKNRTSTSQASKTASFTIPRPSDTAPSPSDYEPDSESQGPELNLLGDRAVSTISLPSTEGPPSTKSSEDGKPSLELYRKPLCESDADDEASDKETHHGSDEEAIDDSEKEPFGYDENDEQLQSAMRKIQLGKRSRNGDDDDGRTGNNRDELDLRSAPSAKQWMLQMRGPREAERERDIAKEMEALSQSTKNEQSAGPAKRRKGSDGQLVGMGSSLLDVRTEEG